MEIYVDDDTTLVLHNLKQHYVQLQENEKTRKLMTLLDILDFNQVIIFVKSVKRCEALLDLLTKNGFPAIAMHGGMSQPER